MKSLSPYEIQLAAMLGYLKLKMEALEENSLAYSPTVFKMPWPSYADDDDDDG